VARLIVEVRHDLIAARGAPTDLATRSFAAAKLPARLLLLGKANAVHQLEGDFAHFNQPIGKTLFGHNTWLRAATLFGFVAVLRPLATAMTHNTAQIVNCSITIHLVAFAKSPTPPTSSTRDLDLAFMDAFDAALVTQHMIRCDMHLACLSGAIVSLFLWMQ
jgi:hypothetical protein